MLVISTVLIDSAASFGLHDDVIRTSQSSPEKKYIIIDDALQHHSNRRLFLSSMIASTMLGISSPAYASKAKGAAEYDFEYYMRDLL